ncbi:MAG: ABC transporter permease [Clostridia bacterium]|nr:ABC transporter permease [Clostridia bacterium]
MNCRGNSSFVQLLLGSSNLASLEMTFSLMFVLVGALVIYATISKMIDEQRNLVGAGKALGLFNREIFAKYLLFGVSSTIIGTTLGILSARFLMEIYVLKSARPYYTFDTSKPMLVVSSTAIALAAGALLSVAATWFACTKLLRSTAIQLMQPKVPAGRKKAGHSKHLLSLYSRLILLNIRSDLRRVIVTVVSVAGCCALVVIGFTLKSAVEGALSNQYSRIVDYDGRIKYDVLINDNAADAISQRLDRDGIAYTQLHEGVVTFRVTDILVGELLCGDISQISAYYHLLDWKTNEPLAPTDSGILIQKRTAESYGLDIGSELELTLANSRTANVRVAGIFDNYIGRVMVMSRDYYRQQFGDDCIDNEFYIRLYGANDDRLLEDLLKIDGYENYTRSDSEKSLFASTSTLVTAIVALFIFMAAVMAGVVLTNLTNTYILQKKRELTIMRINGFTVKEVITYVTREMVVTTILGVLFGIVMGAVVSYRITRAIETAFVQYDRSICLPAWAFGAVITVFFTVIINVIVLRKVKNLKLTDMD